MLGLWIPLYLVVATCVVLLSIKISQYVNLLDKKTKMSGAVIGGVFLAAVTSIPELFTSISSIFIVPGTESSQMVIGNILGSALFNSCVLALTFVFTYQYFRKTKVGKGQVSTTITLIIFYLLVAYATFMPDSWQFRIGGAVNIISIILLIVYAISLKFMSDAEGQDHERHDPSPLTVKQIVIRFVLLSIVLIGASIGITYITDIISESLNLGKTFAGALFLGVATSLPEVSATISLCKLGNVNAAMADIIGSNTFNFMILVLADIVSWKYPVYCNNTQSLLLIVLGAVSACVMCFAICYKVFRKYPPDSKGPTVATRILYTVCFSIIALCYILFLILSNVL